MRSLLCVCLICLALLGTLLVPSPAQEKKAASYHAQVRFRIEGGRRQRAEQYLAMLKAFEAAGFKKDKGLEGEIFFSDSMTGKATAAAVDRMLQEPHVQIILLTPEGYTSPSEAEKPVLLNLFLLTRFGPGRQKEIAEKTRALLKALGFVEAVGHDHRGHTRLLGWLPSGQIPALLKDDLQVDLLLPTTEQLGPPSIKVTPIQRAEVLPELEDSAPPKELPAVEPLALEQAKVSPDLRTFIAGLEGDATKQPIRVEVILRTVPRDVDSAWREMLEHSPYSMIIEGRIGPLVTGLMLPDQLNALAALPEISTVRLPQRARPFVLGPFNAQRPQPLPVEFLPMGRELNGARGLSALVRRRQPQRSAVIAADFRGYESFVGNRLPAKTHLLDFTGERRADLQPDPGPDSPETVGVGTRLALALTAQVPADELFLVRIDPAAPYQIEQVARSVSGEPWYSISIVRRQDELRRDQQRLDEQRVELRVERRLQLENFAQDETSRAAREAYRKRQREFDQAERVYQEKSRRFLNFLSDADRLKDVGTVLLGLYWTEGHPAVPEGRAALRYMNPELFRSASWIQAVPRGNDQVWHGFFQDEDDDGDMEFGRNPVSQRNRGSGGTERTDLNFLAWQPYSWQAKPADSERKGSARDLPANAVVQLTVQWREVHSPEWKQALDEDHYRQPIVPLTLTVLRQRDPAGRAVPNDIFDTVARSTGLPERLENHARYAVYESTVRFQVEQPGRYAIQLIGQSPQSTLPREAPKLPHSQQWELYPRIRVDVADPATRSQGRVVFQSFSREPGDSSHRNKP